MVKTEAPRTLPASLVTMLPVAAGIMTRVRDIEKMLPQMRKELEAASKKGTIPLARAFVVLHRANTRIDELRKAFVEIFETYKIVKLPEAMEQDGITNVPLAEGYRVQVSVAYRASIKPDQKEAAYQWLQDNDFAELITATVNASTLSASAKNYMEDEGKEFPDKLFNVALVPNTSVVSTK